MALCKIIVPVNDSMIVSFKLDKDLLMRSDTTLIGVEAIALLKRIKENPETCEAINKIEFQMNSLFPGFDLIKAYNINKPIRIEKV